MKTITPGGTISLNSTSLNNEPATQAGIAINRATSKSPGTYYGANASRIALLKECFTSLLRKPPGITTLLLTLALILPASIVIISTGINSIEKNLLDSRHVTVFLAKINNQEAARLAESLATDKHILSAELTLEDLHNKKVLSIDIQPAATLDESQLNDIVAGLNSNNLVDYVSLNPIWLTRNVDAINKIRQLRWLSTTVAALLTFVLVYLFTSTDLSRQKSELRVLRHMGASGPTMLKPLMLRCVIQAVFAGAIGTLLAWIIVASLLMYVDSSTYGQILPSSLPVIRLVLLTFFAVFSSFLTVRSFGRKLYSS